MSRAPGLRLLAALRLCAVFAGAVVGRAVSDPAAVARLRGRPWSDEALLGLSAIWPTGGLAAGGGPALPLLALSTGVATLYPAAWTPSADLNLPCPGRGPLLARAGSAASSAPLPPRAQPADTVLAARTSPGEDVVLVADLWVTTALPAGVVSRGDATSPTGAPVSRGIPVGRTGFFVPDGTGDSRPGQLGTRSRDATTSASPYAAKLPLGYITGLDIAVRIVNWTLTGVPGAAITAVFAARGAQLPHSGASPHVVSLASPTTSMVLPPGAFIPGYVYAAEAAMDMAVALAVDYSALATGTPPTPPTRGAGRRMLLSVDDADEEGGRARVGGTAGRPAPSCIFCSVGSTAPGCGDVPTAGWYVLGTTTACSPPAPASSSDRLRGGARRAQSVGTTSPSPSAAPTTSPAPSLYPDSYTATALVCYIPGTPASASTVNVSCSGAADYAVSSPIQCNNYYYAFNDVLSWQCFQRNKFGRAFDTFAASGVGSFVTLSIGLESSSAPLAGPGAPTHPITLAVAVGAIDPATRAASVSVNSTTISGASLLGGDANLGTLTMSGGFEAPYFVAWPVPPNSTFDVVAATTARRVFRIDYNGTALNTTFVDPICGAGGGCYMGTDATYAVCVQSSAVSGNPIAPYVRVVSNSSYSVTDFSTSSGWLNLFTFGNPASSCNPANPPVGFGGKCPVTVGCLYPPSSSQSPPLYLRRAADGAVNPLCAGMAIAAFEDEQSYYRTPSASADSLFAYAGWQTYSAAGANSSLSADYNLCVNATSAKGFSFSPQFYGGAGGGSYSGGGVMPPVTLWDGGSPPGLAGAGGTPGVSFYRRMAASLLAGGVDGINSAGNVWWGLEGEYAPLAAIGGGVASASITSDAYAVRCSLRGNCTDAAWATPAPGIMAVIGSAEYDRYLLIVTRKVVYAVDTFFSVARPLRVLDGTAEFRGAVKAPAPRAFVPPAPPAATACLSSPNGCAYTVALPACATYGAGAGAPPNVTLVNVTCAAGAEGFVKYSTDCAALRGAGGVEAGTYWCRNATADAVVAYPRSYFAAFNAFSAATPYLGSVNPVPPLSSCDGCDILFTTSPNFNTGPAADTLLILRLWNAADDSTGADACSTLCASTPSCRAWTFTSNTTGSTASGAPECEVKSTISGPWAVVYEPWTWNGRSPGVATGVHSRAVLSYVGAAFASVPSADPNADFIPSGNVDTTASSLSSYVYQTGGASVVYSSTIIYDGVRPISGLSFTYRYSVIRPYGGNLNFDPFETASASTASLSLVIVPSDAPTAGARWTVTLYTSPPLVFPTTGTCSGAPCYSPPVYVNVPPGSLSVPVNALGGVRLAWMLRSVVVPLPLNVTIAWGAPATTGVPGGVTLAGSDTSVGGLTRAADGTFDLFVGSTAAPGTPAAVASQQTSRRVVRLAWDAGTGALAATAVDTTGIPTTSGTVTFAGSDVVTGACAFNASAVYLVSNSTGVGDVTRLSWGSGALAGVYACDPASPPPAFGSKCPRVTACGAFAGGPGDGLYILRQARSSDAPCTASVGLLSGGPGGPNSTFVSQLRGSATTTLCPPTFTRARGFFLAPWTAPSLPPSVTMWDAAYYGYSYVYENGNFVDTQVTQAGRVSNYAAAEGASAYVNGVQPGTRFEDQSTWRNVPFSSSGTGYMGAGDTLPPTDYDAAQQVVGGLPDISSFSSATPGFIAVVNASTGRYTYYATRKALWLQDSLAPGSLKLVRVLGGSAEFRGVALAPAPPPEPTAPARPFTAGNIVALRLGSLSSAAPLNASLAYAVFLDEYAADTGARVQTWRVPNVTLSPAAVAGGAAAAFGALSRTGDGRALLFGGLDAPAGTAVSSAGSGRLVVSVSPTGAVNTSTRLSMGGGAIIRAVCGATAASAYVVTSAPGRGLELVALGAAATETVIAAAANYTACAYVGGSSPALFLVGYDAARAAGWPAVMRPPPAGAAVDAPVNSQPLQAGAPAVYNARVVAASNSIAYDAARGVLYVVDAGVPTAAGAYLRACAGACTSFVTILPDFVGAASGGSAAVVAVSLALSDDGATLYGINTYQIVRVTGLDAFWAGGGSNSNLISFSVIVSLASTSSVFVGLAIAPTVLPLPLGGSLVGVRSAAAPSLRLFACNGTVWASSDASPMRNFNWQLSPTLAGGVTLSSNVSAAFQLGLLSALLPASDATRALAFNSSLLAVMGAVDFYTGAFLATPALNGAAGQVSLQPFAAPQLFYVGPRQSDASGVVSAVPRRVGFVTPVSANASSLSWTPVPGLADASAWSFRTSSTVAGLAGLFLAFSPADGTVFLADPAVVGFANVTWRGTLQTSYASPAPAPPASLLTDAGPGGGRRAVLVDAAALTPLANVSLTPVPGLANASAYSFVTSSGLYLALSTTNATISCADPATGARTAPNATARAVAFVAPEAVDPAAATWTLNAPVTATSTIIGTAGYLRVDSFGLDAT